MRTDGCPRKVEPEATCRANLVGKIYEGTSNETFDHRLEPFTGLLSIICTDLLNRYKISLLVEVSLLTHRTVEVLFDASCDLH